MEAGKLREKIGVILGLLMQSFPIFVSGIFVLMVFSYWLGWFPLGGIRSAEHQAWTGIPKVWDVLRHLILPLAVAVLCYIGDIMMISRTSMLELIGEEFLEFSKARGLPDSKVRKIAMRNAILPVLTYSTIMIGFAFGGQVIIEVVFSWPGIGRLMVDSVSTHDYPVAQATFFIMAVVVIVMNLVMDLAYVFLDPRIAIGETIRM